MKTLGFKAIHLTPYSHKHTLDSAAFEPFYAEAAKLDVPLMLHPASFGELINRYDNFFAMHILGRPFNCTAGLVALVTGGVFERYPICASPSSNAAPSGSSIGCTAWTTTTSA